MPTFDDKAEANQILAASIIAGSPDGQIEASEARGQEALVHSADLPKDIYGLTFAEIEAGTGIKFGEQINDLFVAATLPEGWSKRATDHSMHTELLDEKGRVRATIFYKASVYDRSAHMGFNRFYRVRTLYEDSQGRPRYTENGENPEYDGKEYHHIVVENHDGTVVHDAGRVAMAEESGAPYRETCDKARALANKATKWLDAEFPEHARPFSYWD